MYSEKLLEHFMSPQNVGEISGADGVGNAGGQGCGDVLTLYIKVKDDILEDVQYLVTGCAAAIATSSMTSVMAKGKPIKDALNITEESVIQALDGLPEGKEHCSNLGVTALLDAIKNYQSGWKQS